MTRSPTRAHARLFLSALAALLAALVAAPAGAQEGSPPEASASPDGASNARRPEGPRARVAVLLLAAAEVDPTVADALSETLIGAVAARGGVTLIGQTELGAQLELDDAQLLECVAAPTCLGRIGVQLGLAEVIAGTLGQRGARWVFNLNRLDVESGETRARVFREVEGDLGALADGLSAAVPDLYAPPPPPPPPAASALSVVGPAGVVLRVDGRRAGLLGPDPLRVEVSPGAHVIEAELPTGPWVRRVTLAAGEVLRLEPPPPPRVEESPNPLLFVSAAVAVTAFGVALGLGVHSQESLSLSPEQRRQGEVSRAEAVRFYAAREREAIVADVLFGVAGAAVIAGVVALFLPDRELVEVGLSGARFRF